ncbi:hypothetical protein EYF80_005558 [Liparis tanakae]|uniref:Uncharacterized protein n=1 Tax=Liparis tanakae TaxID=230148 RepID=A0A4Z2J2R8_9TELE|nr:hypothetical protein EYF80_005558 [Liparis tanakae]
MSAKQGSVEKECIAQICRSPFPLLLTPVREFLWGQYSPSPCLLHHHKLNYIHPSLTPILYGHKTPASPQAILPSNTVFKTLNSRQTHGAVSNVPGERRLCAVGDAPTSTVTHGEGRRSSAHVPPGAWRPPKQTTESRVMNDGLNPQRYAEEQVSASIRRLPIKHTAVNVTGYTEQLYTTRVRKLRNKPWSSVGNNLTTNNQHEVKQPRASWDPLVSLFGALHPERLAERGLRGLCPCDHNAGEAEDSHDDTDNHQKYRLGTQGA